MSDRALSVDAELVVEGGSRTFRVWSEDNRIVVDAPSVSALRAIESIRAALPTDALDPGERLADAGLTVELQVRRSPVATVGAGVTGDPLVSRLTGLDAAVDWRGVATAAVRALG
ncbi:hypothetical protein [Halosimplex salinum]|uniref:hypothetical protein n=1 Tax=Halosimplex salinum TaxID=1710538 RepID=UPI000F483BDD|nr:hypothetical protein [Halosimplex salinum]